MKIEFDTTTGKERFNKDFNRRIRDAAGVGETDGVQFVGDVTFDLENGSATFEGEFIPARSYKLTFEFVTDSFTDRAESFAAQMRWEAPLRGNEMLHLDSVERAD